MNINSSFYIKVFPDGSQYPLMDIEPKSLEMLQHLARGHMSNSEGVCEELIGIDSVLNGNKEMHSFGGDDWCIINFKKNKSTIINGFDEFKPFEIDSHLITNLLRGWYNFLLAYENGEIPGIIHPKNQS